MDKFVNHSLQEYNTFRVKAICQSYVRFSGENEIKKFVASGLPERFFIIGEGSNLLFVDDFPGTILAGKLKGIEVRQSENQQMEVISGSGENWDEFVGYCCRNNFGGLENLSLIPGSVGSSAVQNIGAYGVEAKDRIAWVEGIDLHTGKKLHLKANECKFEYRNSIFKNELRNRVFITGISFLLDKKPTFQLDYGNLREHFYSKKQQDINSLRDSICEIRQSKLPDHKTTGNAGSFFKNPVIEKELFLQLQKKYPSIAWYPAGEKIKIPAAWLIEKAGWKGKREGQTGTWPLQPLVIVNYGNASGKEIFNFSEKIKKSVFRQFGIELEREVMILP